MARWSALLPSAGRVVFDLKDVGRIDSTCVAMLIALKRSAQINEIEIAFANPPAQLLRLAKFYQLSDLLGLEPAA